MTRGTLPHSAAEPPPTAAPPMLPDSRGTCWPQPPGSSTDLAAALWAQRQHARALALSEAWQPRLSGWWQRYLQTLYRLLAEMPPELIVAAFRPAVASLALDPERRELDPVGTALGVIRFLVGGPNTRPLALVIPAEAFGTAGRLYFPHLHTVLESQGPLAVEADFYQVRFTWTDGSGATLPAAPPDEDPGGASRGLTRLATVAGWRVLNGTPDLAQPLAELPTSPLDHADPSQLDALANGARLLQRVWPEAALAAHRYLDSVLLQPVPEQGYVTSVSLGRLQGTLVASMRDPIQVADALCHEGSHTRLGLFLHHDSLIEDDGAPIHPSPWRKDLRPLKGLLNGVHAFVNVCELYRRLAEAEPTLAVYLLEIREAQRQRVLAAWSYLEPRMQPTPLGQELARELGAAVQALQ